MRVVERWNSEGIPRDQLMWALTQRPVIRSFRKLDSCMLCRRKGVNEAALCEACFSMLDGIEFDSAQQWLSGVRV